MGQWEHVTDIPEEFLISCPNRLFNGDSIKMVGVHDRLLILTDDICVEFNVATTKWKEVELAPPARSNPIVIASDNDLFIIGGSCMGKHLVSGQIQHQDLEDEAVAKHPGKCDDEVGLEALPRAAPRQQTLSELLLLVQQQQEPELH